MKRKKMSRHEQVEADIHRLLEEIREENRLLEEQEKKMREAKKRLVRRMIIALIAVALLLTGGYVFVSRQTYQKIHVLNTYKDKADGGEQYVEFADGILQYSRDGASFANKKGQERWNASYQIKNPIVRVKGKAAAIADKSGNDILVFQKKGLKGEIHTTLPIEMIAVSSQGIVSAVLKDGTASKIVCYDAGGNILVENKASVASMGYPMAVDISDNGYMLLVSYLIVEDGAITSKVSYYNFGEEGKQRENFLVTEDVYHGMIVPTVFFMDNDTSAVVADHALMIYEGKQAPVKTETISIKNQIKSVCHNKKYVGIVTQNENGDDNTVTLYNKAGQPALAKEYDGEYKNIKISGSQILMYDGKKCNVITKSGVQKFDGEFESDILDIIPLAGINKYLVINANGLQEVRFAK